MTSGDERRIPIGKSIIAGFKAPWAHAGGLLKCSALWVVAEFLYQLEVAGNRTWHENAEGESVWEYEGTAYGYILLAVRLFALSCFFLSWSRGLYLGDGDREFRVWRFERRIWWLLRDSCKLIFGLAIVSVVFVVAFMIINAIVNHMGTFGAIFGSTLGLGLFVVIIGIACRLATFCTAIAVDDEPRAVVDAVDVAKGYGFRIFLVVTPLILCWSIVDAVCFGSGSALGIRVPGAPFWPEALPQQIPPIWVVGLATAVDWVFLASLFATLAELYRYVTPRFPDDQALRLF